MTNAKNRTQREGPTTMQNIEQTIETVGELFETVTGRRFDDTDTGKPIPAERDPEQYIQEQLDRLSAMLGESAQPLPATPAVTAPIAIWESDHELIARVDLPGVSRDKLHVHVERGLLHVAGHRTLPVTKGARLIAQEQSFGPYQRVIALPPGTSSADVSAKIADGVLEVRLQRAESRVTGPTEVLVK